jgi:hypothetical protein
MTMQGADMADTARRSSRIPVALPILVTSLEPNSDFSEICETLMVNAHGCSMRSPEKLEAGVPVQFQSKDGNWTMAHIVDCQPLGSGQMGWKLGAMLDQPENFWGLESYPDDWAQSSGIASPGKKKANHTSTPSQIGRDKVSMQAQDEHVKALVAQAVQPLQAEVMALRENVGKAAPRRSQFDISLTHIPPEVEEKLWVRLREDLGKQVLQQTRQQSEELLESAKDAIGKKIHEGQNEFRAHLTQELESVEQKAQGLSGQLGDTVQQRLNAGAARFQQQVLEAGIRHERRSEEFLRSLQQRLSEEHDGYRKEMEQAQREVASETSRLNGQAADIASRINRLDETARKLESELDARLMRMGSEIINSARTQLESAVDVVLKELGTRNSKELEKELNHACSHLKTVQKNIESSISALIKAEVSEALVSFGQTMEALAQDSVGRWRSALARDLTSVTKILGGEFRMDTASEISQD